LKRGYLVILPNEMFAFGDRVFYYDHTESGDPDFDSNWVRIYEDDSHNEPIMYLHK
jgi:hypothetical protein